MQVYKKQNILSFFGECETPHLFNLKKALKKKTNK